MTISTLATEELKEMALEVTCGGTCNFEELPDFSAMTDAEKKEATRVFEDSKKAPIEDAVNLIFGGVEANYNQGPSLTGVTVEDTATLIS
jgi:hypothetical protein